MADGKKVHGISKDLVRLATPIVDLSVLPGNPRRGDVDACAKSYQTFGQTKPVVVWAGDTCGEHPELDGKLIVLDGNHQFLGAAQLGWTHLAAHDMSKYSWDQAKAYSLAANRVGDLGGMDRLALADFVASIDDVGLMVGFGDDEIAELVASVEPPDIFEMDSDEDVARLDQRTATKCPSCGHEFMSGWSV